MRDIYIFIVLAMMITVSTSLAEPKRHRNHKVTWDNPDFNMDDRNYVYDSFNIRGCGDGHIQCASDMDLNDIDRAKLLDIVSNLLHEAGYQPFQKLFVFKGKKKERAQWRPWINYSEFNSHIEFRKK